MGTTRRVRARSPLPGTVGAAVTFFFVFVCGVGVGVIATFAYFAVENAYSKAKRRRSNR